MKEIEYSVLQLIKREYRVFACRFLMYLVLIAIYIILLNVMHLEGPLRPECGFDDSFFLFQLILELVRN